MNKEKPKSKIPLGLMWSITILVWLLTIIWSLDWSAGNYQKFSLILLICAQLLCLIVFIIDIIDSDIFHKAGWIIMIVIIPVLSYPIYLLQRKRLLRIQRRANNFTKS